ncbi:hypothetical protein OA105_01920 [Prochlorococcus sp. AH-736-B08]|nr:hypothetical protein [Prochlorococcus sp. AH-736-B08]
MSLKISKFLCRFLLGVYAYFLIHLIVPTLIFYSFFPFILEIPFLNIFLFIGLILLEGYIFLWKIPWFLYKKSGFKKRYYPILPITSIITIPFFSFLYFPQDEQSVKTYQKEASYILSGSLKASQAFYSEIGKLATSTKDIGEYITVSGCKTNDSRICRNSDIENYSNKEITRWYSPSGNYEIEMKSDNDQNIFVATPTGKIKREGLGVSGCFNSKNGKTKILEMDTKGTNVEIANCDD